jgi:hypothetical protein
MNQLEMAYWTAWALGTALIVMSWMDIVSPETGWLGFAIAGAAVFVSYVVKWRGGEPARPASVLVTRAMLESKNHSYDDAIQRLRNGGTLVCEGLAITIRGETIYCSVVASRPVAQLDEMHAFEDGQRARREFDVVARMSPELAALAHERKLVIQLLTNYSDDGVVIGEIADDRMIWKIPRTAHA